MKNKTYLPVLGIALFIYIFELRILDQLNITSQQFFIVNKFYNQLGKEVYIVDFSFILLIILLILYVFPSKAINKINSSIVNLFLWSTSLTVFIFETNLRPTNVFGDIDVKIFEINYAQLNDVYYTSLNSLAYFLILIFIINVFLMIRTKNKFILVNFVLIVVCWLEYMSELKKFPLSYNGEIKSNLFRTLFVDIELTIVHYTVFLILFPILLNTLVLINKYLKKVEKMKSKPINESIESMYNKSENNEE